MKDNLPEELRVRILAASKLLKKAAEKAHGELRNILLSEAEKLEKYLELDVNVMKEYAAREAYEQIVEEIREWLWSREIRPSKHESEINNIVDKAFKDLEERLNEIISEFEEAIKIIEERFK
jgi:hypothetical protein